MDYTILVNVKYKDVVQTNYDLKQQDYGQKLIVIAEDYDINGTTASLFINKSDGTVNERIMLKDNDSYTYILDADDTSSAGKTVFDVKYYKQGVRDSSASFIFNIIPDRFGNLIESKTMSDSLQSALDRVDRTIEIVDEYDEKIEQINKASGRAENAATNSVIAVANCEQATNKANVATDRANTAAATAEGIAENKTGVNDNAVGASTTWSSSKINTSLANQIATAQGSNINLPSTFNGGLLLNEIQGKSVQNGTPSPDAKVDIVSVGDSGSVVVKKTGKNLIPKFTNLTQHGISVVTNTDGSITLNGTATSGLTVAIGINITLDKGDYCISSTTALLNKMWLSLDNQADTMLVGNKSDKYKTFKLTEKKSYTHVILFIDTGVTLTNYTLYPQLEVGTTSTAYEPYKEQLVTIPLTQPLRSVGSVYDRGCVKSGGLWGNERKFATKIFDGSSDESWLQYATNTEGKWRYAIAIKDGVVADLLNNTASCSHFKLLTSGQTYFLNQGFTISIDPATNIVTLYVYYDGGTVANFKSWLSSNPITVQYKLATPVFEEYTQAIQDQLNALQTYQGVTNVFTTDALQPTLSVSYGKTDSSALSLYASNMNDNKLDKASVVNNLITTVEGTVLDGRQGKALSEKIGNLSNLTTTSKTDLVGAVNEVNNNLSSLGQLVKSSCVTTGSIVVPISSANFDIFNWITISSGTYIIYARANRQDGTIFSVQSVNSSGVMINEVASANDYCEMCVPYVIDTQVILAFKVKSTASEYTIWNDPMYYSFGVLRIK